MLAANMNLGAKNLNHHMRPYVFARRSDGVHIVDIKKTWAKITLAARIIAAVDNMNDVVLVSAEEVAQRAAMKFAKYTGCKVVVNRFVPGTFTNYITRNYIEPRVVIVQDPRVDHQAVLESSYVNAPVIAFTNTDADLKNVDVAIPCNNKSKHSVGLGLWLLAREVLRIRGVISRTVEWEVMVDMFFQRTKEDVEKELAAKKKAELEEARANDVAATEGAFEEEDAEGEWNEGGDEEWAADQWGEEGEGEWAE